MNVFEHWLAGKFISDSKIAGYPKKSLQCKVPSNLIFVLNYNNLLQCVDPNNYRYQMKIINWNQVHIFLLFICTSADPLISTCEEEHYTGFFLVNQTHICSHMHTRTHEHTLKVCVFITFFSYYLSVLLFAPLLSGLKFN